MTPFVFVQNALFTTTVVCMKDDYNCLQWKNNG